MPSPGQCVNSHLAQSPRKGGVARNSCPEPERLAKGIRELKATSAPPKAVVGDTVRLGEVLDKAIAQAELKREQLERIDPLPVYRLENSDYKQSSTRVVLLDVSTYDLVKFVLAVQRPQVRLMDLRLTARSREALNWRAELTFSILIYDPQERTR